MLTLEKAYYDSGFRARVRGIPRSTGEAVSDNNNLRTAWYRGWDDADAGYREAE